MTTPLPTLVDRSDVEARLGETLEGPDALQADSLIEFAQVKLRALLPSLDARLSAGGLDQVLVRGTLVSAICRGLDVMRVGLRVRSEAYPEVTTTYADAPGDLIAFTDDELSALAPSAGISGGAFTIRPGGGL
ncbi:hypothetical protein DW322_11260 [Rhodococcus rhodnii]|uniref:Phage protein Gp19/Gp15/Gp42 n=2 Tax=Rhodococcus rhodnii TaxID=38312 RepID=R7WRW7_9NOCA|nr:hypothetical protein [Rhodococcus rhodnii]EOM78063.1 hypothetical protein Rrhod_0604 [Rhodococcus rhodnii LMG 5362]TXG90689.1 hypothetical protein DW322_11260 [Rhodococcus rhodnii]